jgi:nicotinate-nucleotide pyrophosphorylase (carboxylating)
MLDNFVGLQSIEGMQQRRFSKQQLAARLKWQDMDADYLRQLVGLGKIEDLAGAGLAARPELFGDVTSMLMPEGGKGSAALVARVGGIVCGLPLIAMVLAAYGEGFEVECAVEDGMPMEPGLKLATIAGPAIGLLQAERVMLNFLQHLSGIASETRLYVDALDGSATCLLDTRKTTPGYRVLEKYAVACGGGYNHRIGLFDRIMLKDNHLRVAGCVAGEALTEAVRAARSVAKTLAVEVEIDTLAQLEPVLQAGADVVLLDNFTTADLSSAVAQNAGRAYLEASGGITLERLPELAALGLDFISTGALVHQSRWCDIGLDWL